MAGPLPPPLLMAQPLRRENFCLSVGILLGCDNIFQKNRDFFLWKAQSSMKSPEYYTMPGVLYNARSSIQCLEFYTMPGVLYNARRFLYKPGVIYNARRFLYKTRSSLQCSEFNTKPGKSLNLGSLLEQSERGFFDGVDISGNHRLDFRKKTFFTEQSLKNI